MARRGAGEGSIYKRADGMWVGVAHLGWYDGKRQRKSVYGKTRSAVAERLRDVQAKADAGQPIPPEHLTVGDLLTQWLNEAVAGHVRPTTQRDYESIVSVHLRPTLGHIRLRSLGAQDVQRLVNAKAGSGLSPRRVAYIRTVLGAALRTAVRWGWITANPASVAKVPPAKPYRVEAMPPDTARAILAALASHRETHLFTVAIATGLRQGELRALRWADVSLSDKPGASSLTVTGTLHRLHGEYIRPEPKTEQSRRTISIPEIAVDALRARRIEQAEHRLAAGPHWRDTLGLVFTTPWGKPLHGPTITRNLQAALSTAGLPRMRFHDLRHAAATLMLAQGVPLKVIQTTLGHSTIMVTSSVYAHVLPELQQEAAAMMDRALRKPADTVVATVGR